jgi:hypothetical protein
LKRSLWYHLTAPQWAQGAEHSTLPALLWAQEVKEGSACDFSMLICSFIDGKVLLGSCDVIVLLEVLLPDLWSNLDAYSSCWDVVSLTRYIYIYDCAGIWPITGEVLPNF